MIATTAIDHVLNTTQGSSRGVAYVYCNYKTSEEQDVPSLLAAILRQLVQGRLSTVNHIERSHQKHADQGPKPSLDEIYSTLRDVLAHYPTVYMVIGALDECQEETHRQFLAKLRNLQAVRDVRLMATSRFIPDVEDTFGEARRLGVRASRDDIKHFVVGKTYRLPTYVQRSITLQEIVQEHKGNAVDGIFFIARLHYTSQFGLPGITQKALASENVPIAETVNAEDSWGNTPLTIATKTGQYEMAKLLLDRGTEVNTQGGFYGNALNAASSEGHEQVVKMLLNAGAHPLQ